MVKRLLYIAIPVFACMTFVYSIFIILFADNTQEPVRFNFFVFLASSLISATINFALSYKTRTIVTMAITNALLATISVVAVFIAENTLSGVFANAVAVLIIIIPIMLGLALSITTIKAKMMLSFTEVSIVGTAILFLLQLGIIDIPNYLNLACIISLLLNLLMLSSLRMSGDRNDSVAGTKMLGRGALLAIACSVVFLIGFVGVFFLVPSVRNAIVFASIQIKSFVTFILTSVYDGVAFLLSLIPQRDGQGMPPIEQQGAGGEMGETEGLSELTINIEAVVAIVAILLVALIIIVVLKLRKTKIGSIDSVELAEKEEIENTSFFDLIKRFFGFIKRRSIYLKTLIINRKTYEGAYIVLVRTAARKKMKKDVSETHIEFCEKLLCKLPSDSANIGDAKIFFKKMCETINCRCFSDKTAETLIPMKKSEVALLSKLKKELF